ncbi:MAG: SRPBCC domain-containing protein [Alphaproteobacteria bacterium]|nr:SRPBCC domain-containing protein [Alphaproteobacteria bacterium]
MNLLPISAIAVLALSGAAQAAVQDVQANGFSIEEDLHIEASPDKVYETLIQPKLWWSSAHTFSGDAKNMTMDARAGGCWCETLPGGGGVLHMTVVNAQPGKRLVLHGALGPFQTTGMDGAMNFILETKDKGKTTELTLVYNLGGYVSGGYGALPQSADGVLNIQTKRLKKFIETGTPDYEAENTEK